MLYKGKGSKMMSFMLVLVMMSLFTTIFIDNVTDAAISYDFIDHAESGLRFTYDEVSGTFTMADRSNTGPGMQWLITDAGSGWSYLDHRETGKRLRYNGTGDYLEMVDTSYADNSVRWQFVGSGDNWSYLVNGESGKRLRYDSTTKQFSMVDSSYIDNTVWWEQKTAIETNLLLNSGFEDGNTVSWDGNGGTIGVDANTVNTGNYSGKVTNRTAKWHGTKQGILSVLQNKGSGTYTASAMVRLASGSGTGMLRIKLNNKNNDIRAAINSTSWTRIEISVTVNNAAALTNAYFLVRTGDSLADLLVDDCYLKKGAPGDPDNVSVNIDPSITKWKISKYLTGMHFVYAMEDDSIYADGRIANWAGANNVGISRFPGGTVVKYWDWANPTGVFKGDNWDPAWDPANQVPASEWMSIDEYMQFVQTTGMEPMMGININSGHRYNRVADSVQRAKDQVQYCIDKGYNVKWWYIGNEEGYGVSTYISYINQHVNAMKQVDPNIKTIINDNGLNESRLKTFLQGAGSNIDLIEFHNKWKAWKVDGYFEEWASEYPIFNGTLRQKIDNLRSVAVQEGYPNLQFGNNEWGLTSSMHGFDKYHTSLVGIDFLLELFRGGYDQACYWNTQWDSEPGAAQSLMHLLDSTDNYSFNPVSKGFELLGTALEEQMIEMSSDAAPVYGFACKDITGTKYQLYLINKYGRNAKVKISIPGAYASVNGKVLANPGTVLLDQPVTYNVSTGKYETTLPQYSFVRIIFNK